MSFFSYFSRSRKSRKRSGPKPPARVRPSVESLEDRLTPSVLFTPQHGSVQATTGGGPVLGRSSDMPIYTIFWGKYWASSAGQAYAFQIETSINGMFPYAHYLDSLR